MSGTTIALLPFENLSGDPAQDVIARGLSLDLAVELSRFATLDVIPPTSAAQVVSMGGSRRTTTPMFMLTGGVRRQDDRIRISVSLTETASGVQVWGDRYDPAASGLLAVQDAIVARVASALAIHTDEARLAVARRKPLVSLEAYECWLRGRECLLRGTVEADAEARRFFARALEIDPLFARAHAGLSLSHFNEWSCQAWVQWDEKERLAFTHASRAAELDSTDAMMEIVLGRIMLYRRRYDEAAAHVDRALALNPSDADVLAHAALCRAYLGDGASGLELSGKASRLNPVTGDWYVAPMALSLLVLGRYEASVACGVRPGRRHRPSFRVPAPLPGRVQGTRPVRARSRAGRAAPLAPARQPVPSRRGRRENHDGGCSVPGWRWTRITTAPPSPSGRATRTVPMPASSGSTARRGR